jgi:hypothetical protein
MPEAKMRNTTPSTRPCLKIVIVLVFALGLVEFGRAQSRQATPQDNRKLSETLARLESTNMEIRENGFDDLRAEIGTYSGNGNTGQLLNDFLTKYPGQAERLKVALVRMLKLENEKPTENYPEVIDIVASLNDDRAIPALLGAMDTGQMAIQGLMKYGDKTLDAVLGRLNDPEAGIRAAAVSVAITILAAKGDAVSRSKIRNITETALKDPSLAARADAIYMIGCLEERSDFEPLLEQMAKNDPGKMTWEGGKETYPVRLAASNVLNDIQNKKPCHP